MSELSSYVCPVHHRPLAEEAAGFRCGDCGRTFERRADGIALLDLVQSTEAAAFDEQHVSYDTMGDEEIEGSSRLARRFLALSGVSGKTNPKILDVACGKGELTIGLLQETAGSGADIFAFDHSCVSLEALGRTAAKIGKRNAVHISAQDATALFFEPATFDLVCGNAVLHHFLDWREFITACRELVKPGGTIVLAEPFTDGYVVPMIAFTMAAKLCGMSDRELSEPDMGLYNFITRDIGGRIRGRGNREYLATLTDKHLFLVEDFVKLGEKLGLAAEFENYENASYYDEQLDDLLKTYRITNPRFTAKAREVFADIKEYFGGEYATLFSHFKFVSLRRRER